MVFAGFGVASSYNVVVRDRVNAERGERINLNATLGTEYAKDAAVYSCCFCDGDIFVRVTFLGY